MKNVIDRIRWNTDLQQYIIEISCRCTFLGDSSPHNHLSVWKNQLFWSIPETTLWWTYFKTPAVQTFQYIGRIFTGRVSPHPCHLSTDTLTCKRVVAFSRFFSGLGKQHTSKISKFAYLKTWIQRMSDRIIIKTLENSWLKIAIITAWIFER